MILRSSFQSLTWGAPPHQIDCFAMSIPRNHPLRCSSINGKQSRMRYTHQRVKEDTCLQYPQNPISCEFRIISYVSFGIIGLCRIHYALIHRENVSSADWEAQVKVEVDFKDFNEIANNIRSFKNILAAQTKQWHKIHPSNRSCSRFKSLADSNKAEDQFRY